MPDRDDFVRDSQKDFAQLQHFAVADHVIDVHLKIAVDFRLVVGANPVGVFPGIIVPGNSHALLERVRS